MLISDERIDEFIRLYEQALGDRLSRAEARAITTKLINLYRLILQPLPSDEVTRHVETPAVQIAPAES